MKNKRNVLSCLIILLTGVISFAVQAQQKKSTHRANFSGEWKSKESISMGGNIVCSYDEGDRMLSKIMKIAEQANILTIEIPNRLLVQRWLQARRNCPSTVKKAKLIMAGKEERSLP